VLRRHPQARQLPTAHPLTKGIRISATSSPRRSTAADAPDEPKNEADAGRRADGTIDTLGFLPEAHRHLPYLRLAGDDVVQRRAEAIRGSFGKLRRSPLRILAQPGRLVGATHSRLDATICLEWSCARFSDPHSYASPGCDALRLYRNLRTSTGLIGGPFWFLPRPVCLALACRP